MSCHLLKVSGKMGSLQTTPNPLDLEGQVGIWVLALI